MFPSVKLLGISDDVTTCDCCGRTGLKRTVAMEIGDGSLPVYYGTSCAANALRVGNGKKLSNTELTAEANLAKSKSHYQKFEGRIWLMGENG